MNTTIKHRYEPTTSLHWLEFPDKPDEATRAILKAERWRFISAVMQWRKAGLLTHLPELPEYEYEECGEVDFSAERAEHYEDRAERASKRADAVHSKADAIASFIPFGQPILVDHYSSKRHRRDLDKIDANMRKAIDERNKAKHLNNRAEAALEHQEQKQDPGAIARRLDKIRKDHRAYQNATSAEGQRRRAALEQEIARLETALAAVGGLPADNIDLQKGDLILIHGHIVEVIRLNKKTISGYLANPCHNLYDGENRPRIRNAQKWDRSTFQRRMYTAQEWAAINEGRTQAEAYAIAESQWKELQYVKKAAE